MALTGLFILPIAPGQSSPSSALIQHISRSYPAEPLPTFHLDHRLFVDTSSLLQSSDPSYRRSTSILTLSHTPSKTYVAGTPPKAKSQGLEQPASQQSSTLITIPFGSADLFTQFVGTRLQAQWTHRQSLVIENGTALSLNDGEWTLRIGDLKTPPRVNQAASNLRGMLVEIAYMDTSSDKKNGGEGEDNKDAVATTPTATKEEENLIRSFLSTVTEASGIPSITNPDATRSLIRRTKPHATDKDAGQPDFELANLYLDTLRGPRG